LKEEEELRKFAMRSIQATRNITEGEKFIENYNVALLRPGHQKSGAGGRFFSKILGKKSKRKINYGEGVNLQDATE